jgi:hypothetical protein
MTIEQRGHGLVLAMTDCSSLTLFGKTTWPAGTGQTWARPGHPRLTWRTKDVDRRHKGGHDDRRHDET